MYRLLIVTDVQDVKERMEQIQDWEALGFKRPRLRQSMEETVECLHRHHIDAVAVEQKADFDSVRIYLDTYFPNTPIFQIGKTEGEQLLILRELTTLLSRLNADDTNDEYDEAARLLEERERFLKKVISGRVPGRDDLERLLQLYRCRERADVPCVLARLEMPQDDLFFDERWHYGSERLETALRNFFGREHDGMAMHVAVVSPQEVRVLCYPASEEGIREDVAGDYVEETVRRVEDYLGLALNVMNVQRLPGLAAFAASTGMR